MARQGGKTIDAFKSVGNKQSLEEVGQWDCQIILPISLLEKIYLCKIDTNCEMINLLKIFKNVYLLANLSSAAEKIPEKDRTESQFACKSYR